MSSKFTKAERDEALTMLRELCKPGCTVYTVLRKVSPSGMTRWIDLYVMQDNEPRRITWSAAAVGVGTYDRDDSIKIGGCGMDMGFALVYNLGRALYPDGFGVLSVGGIRPTSREHAAELVAEGRTEFRGRNMDPAGWDNDGGYALTHRWL